MSPRNPAKFAENMCRIADMGRETLVEVRLKNGGSAWFTAPTVRKWAKTPGGVFGTPKGTVTHEKAVEAVLRLRIRRTSA